MRNYLGDRVRADAFCASRTYAIRRTMTPLLKSVVCAVFDPNNPGRIVNSTLDLRRLFSAPSQPVKPQNAPLNFGDETRETLDLIRNIRNAFAHVRLAISFQTDQVPTACNLLHIPVTLSSTGLGTPHHPLTAPQAFAGRLSYETVCHYLSHNFVPWMADGALSIPSSVTLNVLPFRAPRRGDTALVQRPCDPRRAGDAVGPGWRQ
jgi:hypothetical protein